MHYFGISKDSLESHEKWSKKLNLKFELLADEDKTSLKAYKAWAKKNSWVENLWVQ